MKLNFLLAALLLTVSCASHQPPLVVVVPPVVIEPEPDEPRQRKTWYLTMEAKDDDLICAVSWLQLQSPCWQVGYLRSLMLSLKANPE